MSRPPVDPPTTPAVDGSWFRNAVGYQVYVCSFPDTTGNGIGDVWGVYDHVDHIASLGIDFVWLNPVYPSPGLDHGYDVADYTTIADDISGMDAFTALRAALHHRGIRLLMDIVPGHTSDHHAWFRNALTGPDADHRDFYVWHDPRRRRPTQQLAIAVRRPRLDPRRRLRPVLHAPLPARTPAPAKQPDLNWHAPAVHAAIEEVVRTWLDPAVGHQPDLGRHGGSPGPGPGLGPQPRASAAGGTPRADHDAGGRPRHVAGRGPEVVAFRRGDVVVAANLGDDAAVGLPGPGTVVVASDDAATVDGPTLRLGSDTCAIVQVVEAEDGTGRDR